ncbi:MAG: response regulator [Caldimonas sp.]
MPLATILIEDSPAIRKSLIPALAELADVQVIATAETADQGIAALEAHRDTWRLAIVDMSLKAGNGLQVLGAGRERRGDQHMVVLTNYATLDIRRKSTEYGADAVFDKSTELDQFLELCRQYSAGETPQVANAPGAPRPSGEAILNPRQVGGVEELIERVDIDRLLTEAVSGNVKRNVAAVRAHLTRQGLGQPSSQGSAGKEPHPEPKDETGSTQKDE